MCIYVQPCENAMFFIFENLFDIHTYNWFTFVAKETMSFCQNLPIGQYPKLKLFHRYTNKHILGLKCQPLRRNERKTRTAAHCRFYLGSSFYLGFAHTWTSLFYARSHKPDDIGSTAYCRSEDFYWQSFLLLLDKRNITTF